MNPPVRTPGATAKTPLPTCWMYSFIAGKIKTTCRDFLVLKKGLAEEIKNTILHGTDYELVEIQEEYEDIKQVCQFLQHPAFNGDIWKVLQAVEQNFEKRAGLTELMYGQTAAQSRSSADAQIKSDQLRVRPDDMSNKVEDAMTAAARMEAFAARWHLDLHRVTQVHGTLAMLTLAVVAATWWLLRSRAAPTGS